MVVIDHQYHIGLGNKLFKYCFARQIAEKKKYKLIPEPIIGFPETYKVIDGLEINNNKYYISDEYFNLEEIINHDGQIITQGYFQMYSYYIHNKKNIKKWLQIENENFYEKPEPDDLVLHIRLGDYVELGWNLDIEYYLKILKKETYKRAIIISNDHNHDYIKKLKKFGCIVQDNSKYRDLEHIADFVFIKNSKKTIISKSTFSWWATFLGDGKVYFPLLKYPWVYNPKKYDIDLRVYDEDRYIFVTNSFLNEL
jgi:hypothetical protein